MRHPGEGSIRNFERLARVDRDAFRPQRTKHLCQIDGTCFDGPTLEDLDGVIVMGSIFEEELERLKEV